MGNLFEKNISIGSRTRKTIHSLLCHITPDQKSYFEEFSDLDIEDDDNKMACEVDDSSLPSSVPEIDVPEIITYTIVNLVEITETILSFLPCKDLNTCSRVCITWSRIVRKLKQKRHQKAWLLYSGDESPNLADDIDANIALLAAEPKHALVFCSFKLFEERLAVPSNNKRQNKLLSRPRAAKHEKVELEEYLKRKLPPNCDISGSVADGIIGTSWDCTKSREFEDQAAFSTLLLPDIPGLDIITFVADDSPCNEVDIEDANLADKVKDITGLSKEDNPKVILLFFTEMTPMYHETFVEALLTSFEGKVTVAGGLVDDLIYNEEKYQDFENEPILHGYAFCGENVKMASVILPSSVRNQKDVEEKLKILKSCHVPEKNSFAFQIACIARGENFYDKGNVEANVFRKLFPTTPLFGFFGNGEIGLNYTPDYSKPAEANRYSVIHECQKPRLEIHHSYTTVFVMISVGE